MKIYLKMLFVILFIILISCKENVTETTPPTLSDVKILHPNGGEKFIGMEQDTITWSNPETIESMGLYYTIDNGKKWTALANNVNIPSGEFVWTIPDQSSNEVKIKLLAFSENLSKEITSDSYFLIEKRVVKIFQPIDFKIYSLPGIVNIKWSSNVLVNKFELYYSKFGDGKEPWILISDNISPNTNEYLWTLPSIYSNRVNLKVIGVYSENIKIEGTSDTVFAIHDASVLEEEREYQAKFGIGNKWVYLETKGHQWDDDEGYYIIQEVIGDKLENGIKYYNILKQVIKDSITSTNNWVADRENYSPAFVMQNESYTERSWRYYYSSCYDYNEIVFSNQQKVKEYYWEVAESGNAKSKYKRGKDLGIFYYYYMSEGYMVQKDLVGAYIDGVLYGDTTTVN